MILIAIALFVIGFVLLVFAWRGRVVARGQFCRKCRFDLAGLDLDSPESKCPECGRGVQQTAARRTLVRRRSRLGLALSAMLLLGGVGTLGFWASGNASVILQSMPDWAVVGLTDLGMDAALDELVVRVSKVPSTMSASRLSHVIDAGLTHQANLVVGFDPRWGEVLYVACVNGQMSDDQLKQYMLNGVSVDVLIRDRVHQGANKVDALMKISPTRSNALSGGYTGYTVSTKWVGDGVLNQPARKSSSSFGPSALVSVSGQGGWWVNSAPMPIVPTGGALDGEIGSKLTVYTEYDLVLMASSDGFPASLNIPAQKLEDNLVLGRFRIEHEVEIIDPSEPIVLAVDDPELAQRTCEAMGISAIHLLRVVPDPEPGLRTKILSISTHSLNLPANIALQAYLRLDDGQEIEFGQWTTKGSGGDFLSGISWSVDNTNAQSHAEVQAILDKMIEQGKVDVIFRTDAALAEFSPEIAQVIDLTVIFEDLPIELRDDLSRMSSSSADDWIKGRCEDVAEPGDPEQP
jgi:hypothetical protein